MKQVYAYCGTSSEILKRAGSIHELLAKFKERDLAWLLKKLEEIAKGGGLSSSVNFYEKADVHGDDDDAKWIDGEQVLKAAKEMDITPERVATVKTFADKGIKLEDWEYPAVYTGKGQSHRGETLTTGESGILQDHRGEFGWIFVPDKHDKNNFWGYIVKDGEFRKL